MPSDRNWIGGDVTGNVIAGSGNTVGDVTVGAPAGRPSPARPGGRAHRLGLVLDVVAYGQRSAPDQLDVDRRLRDLLGYLLADLDIDPRATVHRTTGDGVAVFLPAGTDPTRALPRLLNSVSDRLTGDNLRFRDRVRLRMTVGSGLVEAGPDGPTGPLIVELSRLIDSPPLRDAVAVNPAADLVVLISNALHNDVIRPGYLEGDRFRRVPVVVKEFRAPAWLWLG